MAEIKVKLFPVHRFKTYSNRSLMFCGIRLTYIYTIKTISHG
jgi:hypothetical protein